jgi:hypothetical protein
MPRRWTPPALLGDFAMARNEERRSVRVKHLPTGASVDVDELALEIRQATSPLSPLTVLIQMAGQELLRARESGDFRRITRDGDE